MYHQQSSSAVRRFYKGFTLMEMLVVVLIIGILGAIALPQYQRAVLKSRYAGLMPVAKAMADSNEAYYLEHGNYAENVTELPVQGQEEYPDGTKVELVSDTDYSYTLAYNDDTLPDNNYLAFQKHSPKFASTTMCEARDAASAEICLALGGTDLGGGVTNGWTAYLLSGDATGSNFCPTGATCNSQGQITQCPNGKTPKDGKCITCDIANAATCSTTSYAAASCNEGYSVSNTGGCEEDPKLQAVAASKCPEGNSRYSCTIKNGKVYRCDTSYAQIDEGTGECVSNGTSTGTYERIYDANGKEIGYYQCLNVSSEHCYYVYNYIPTGDGYQLVSRNCADKAEITKEGACANGYSNGSNFTYDSHGKTTSYSGCSAVDISPTTGQCNKYTSMTTYDNTRYSTNGNRSYVYKTCTTVSTSNPAATCSNYQPLESIQYNEAGTAYKVVKCYNDSNSGENLNADGTCPSNYTIKSYDSASGEFTDCTNGVNWDTATCKTL